LSTYAGESFVFEQNTLGKRRKSRPARARQRRAGTPLLGAIVRQAAPTDVIGNYRRRELSVKILLLAMSLTALTVITHSIGTSVAIAHCRGWQSAVARPWMRIVGTMAYLVVFLLIVHLAEAALWAGALLWWETLPDFFTALYFSLTSYSTVGYGDVLLPKSARLLGPIESVLGVLMLGWSTAVIVAVVQKIFRETTTIGQSTAATSDSSSDVRLNKTQERPDP
jgi:hypothetical protein